MLTEAQPAQPWRRPRPKRKLHGEFASECPGYCGAPGHLLHVGTLKGVGRTSISRPSSTPMPRSSASPSFYDRKTPITAAELLNDRVIPFFDERRDPALPGADRSRHRVLRQPRAPRVRALPGDRGHRPHPHQGAQPANQRNLWSAFHKTVLDEFYRIAFRKRIYATIEQLQVDLDAWMNEYNQARPHQGRWCYGKTPMQTFLDTLPIAKEKSIRAA